jgi:hypothetical protein
MKLVGLALIGLSVLTLAAPVTAQDAEIVVRGDSSRMEIERILEADNVDTSRLGSREVADAMAGIERGRAPEDFWLAYRAHVEAWQRLAETETISRKQAILSRESAEALARAQQAIEDSFDEVERIARSHGARLPTPRWRM